jgi:hypothetical protein
MYTLTYLRTRLQYVRDKPKHIIEKNRPDKPIKRTGLRPIRSERRLHCKTVKASVAKKRDCCTKTVSAADKIRCYENQTYDQAGVVPHFPLVAPCDIQRTYQL